MFVLIYVCVCESVFMVAGAYVDNKSTVWCIYHLYYPILSGFSGPEVVHLNVLGVNEDYFWFLGVRRAKKVKNHCTKGLSSNRIEHLKRSHKLKSKVIPLNI